MKHTKTIIILFISLFISLFLAACGSEEAPTPIPEPIAVVPEPTDVPPTETAVAVSPTDTPEPTNTPEPTETAVPTATPSPVPPTPTSKPKLGNAWQRPADDMLMLYIPGSTFIMDSDEAAHDVTLDAFWMDQTEVTNAQFAQFVEETGYVTSAETEGNAGVYDGEDKEVEGANWQHPQGLTSDLTGLEQHPVVQISWEDANAYCQWADAELPTEAQWEYASRGTGGSYYPWSAYFHEKGGNFCDVNCLTSEGDTVVDDGFALTAPVGSYPGDVSWAGVLDLGGNVSEFVFDWMTADYYMTSPSHNPTGPESGEARTLRGGNFVSERTWMGGLKRLNQVPTSRYDSFGFRCASTDLAKSVDAALTSYTPPQREADVAYAETLIGTWTYIYYPEGKCDDMAGSIWNPITLAPDHTISIGSFEGNWEVFNQVLFMDVLYFDEEPVPFSPTGNNRVENDFFGNFCSQILFQEP